MVIKKTFSNHAIILLICILCFLYLSAGCGEKAVKKGKASQTFTNLKEAFLTEKKSRYDISSIAFWHGDNGRHRALATIENSDVLIVYDAKKGTEIKRFGKSGTEQGEFKHPCDITVVENLVFVLERGNHRVQVLKLPDFIPFGMIGAERLKNPLNLAVYFIEPGCYYLYVTDRYELSDDNAAYILRYSVATAIISVNSTYLQTFGYSPGTGFLHNVESLAVDPVDKHLLVGERDITRGYIKVYTLDGEFTGKIVKQEEF